MRSRLFITMFAITIALVLSACSSHDPTEKLGITHDTGSEFNKQLASEYREIATLMKIKPLATKGLATSNGVIVLPETISSIDNDVRALTKARGLLMHALDNGGRHKYPIDSAKAQAFFDCWVLNDEKASFFNRVKNMPCELKLNETLTRLIVKLNDPNNNQILYNILKPIGKPKLSEVEIYKGPLAPLEKTLFMVFFEWDKDRLTADSMKVINSIASELHTRKSEITRINLLGHADTSGKHEYNDNLSIKRAINTSQAFAALGISHDKMSVAGAGEKSLMIQTPDNVREPSNRRVEITLE